MVKIKAQPLRGASNSTFVKYQLTDYIADNWFSSDHEVFMFLPTI